MKQGVSYEDSQVVLYGDHIAKVIFDREQTKAIELLIQKCMNKDKIQNR